jgi:FkbM family methyltransferase
VAGWIGSLARVVATVVRQRRVALGVRFVLRLSKRDLLRGRLVLPVRGQQIELPLERVWAFAEGDYYERNVAMCFDRLVDRLERPVVYDVGANLGYYTLRAAPRAARVYAFEPVTASAAVLHRNLQRNCLANVVQLRLGVSDEAGRAEITLYETSGDNSLYRRSGAPAVTGTETIELDTIDRLVASGRLEPPDLIKLDVEGSELPALRGAARTISSARPFILTELNEQSCRAAGYGLGELLAELHLHEYRLFGISEDVCDLELYPEGEWVGKAIANVIAAPPGRTPL